MDSIFDEIDSKRIAPQKFSLAILGCVLNVFMTYVSLVLSSKNSRTIVMLNMIIAVLLLFSFKKYLENFQSAKAILWTNIKIAISFSYVPLALFFYYAEFVSSEKHQFGQTILLAGVCYFLLLVLDFISLIGSGIAYKNFKNEPTRLVAKIGLVNTFILPIPCLFSILFEMFQAKLHASHTDIVIVNCILDTFFLIPTFILAVIFHRARKIASQTNY